MSKVRKEPTFEASYGPMVLWWDDIEEIFEVLQTNASSVELETDRYKFTTLNVAKEHFGDTTIYDVKISASSPRCYLMNDRLHVGSGPTSAHIFYNLDRIFRRRERRPRILYSWWLVVPTVALGFGGAVKLPENLQAPIMALQILFLLLYVRAIFFIVRRSLVVHTKRRSEARGFFQRNKDQLLMYLITGVVGALVGFGISQVKDKYMPDWLKLEQKP